MSTLLEIRTQFVKTTGRYDLVVDTSAYLDNGADFYINAGLRALDHKQETPKTRGTSVKNVVANQNFVLMSPGLRAIEDPIWLINSDNVRYPLIKRSRDQVLLYLKGEWSTSDAEQPNYYAIDLYRNVDTEDPLIYDDTDIKKILLGPIPDTAYKLEVSGLWKAVALVEESDQNYWTMEHENLVILAAQYAIEIHQHRNITGQNAILVPLVEALQDIDHDTVREEASGITQMEG